MTVWYDEVVFREPTCTANDIPEKECDSSSSVLCFEESPWRSNVEFLKALAQPVFEPGTFSASYSTSLTLIQTALTFDTARSAHFTLECS